MACRGTNSPPFHSGRVAMRLTPTMATSGRLMMGVVAIAPSLPSDVIEMVEPLNSSLLADPPRAAPATRDNSVAMSQIVRASQ